MTGQNSSDARVRALHDATKRVGLLEEPEHVLEVAAAVASELFGGIEARAFAQEPGPTLRAIPKTSALPGNLSTHPIDVHCVVRHGRALQSSDLFVTAPPLLQTWSFAPIEAEGKVLGVLGVAQPLARDELEAFCAIASVAAVSLVRIEAHDEAVEAERRRARLSRYLSPRVVAHLGTQGALSRCPGTRCNATVLVSDIRGFTALCEQLDAQEVMNLLNRYFEAMIRIVDEEGGVVDKLMGDGLLAVFGAPEPLEKHAAAATRAAARMVLDAGTVAGPSRRGLQIGVGLASGSVVVGDVGGETFLDFTVLGPTVNVAARVEAMTKQLGVPILVTTETAHELAPSLEIGPGRSVNLAGVGHVVQVHVLDPTRVLSSVPPAA